MLGTLHADLLDARHCKLGLEAVTDPARDVLVGRLFDLVVQQRMVERRHADFQAPPQLLDFSPGEWRPVLRQHGAHGGEVAMSMQIAAAMTGRQRRDLAGRFETA